MDSTKKLHRYKSQKFVISSVKAIDPEVLANVRAVGSLLLWQFVEFDKAIADVQQKPQANAEPINHALQAL